MLRLAIIAVLLLLPGAARTQPAPLVGRWAATIDWNTPGGLYITLQIAPDGRLYQHTQNHQGMAFDLTGVWQFDAATSAFQYRWTDWGPKQVCAQVGCSQLPQPQPIGVAMNATLRFLNRNSFIGVTPDGSITWVRIN